MSLQQYLQQKGQATVTTKTSGSLSSFLQSKGNITPTNLNLGIASSTNTSQSTPSVKDNTKKSTNNVFRAIGKELTKPQGVLMKEAEGVAGGLTQVVMGQPKQGLATFLQKQKEALNVIKGTEETSFSKTMEKYIPREKQTAIDKVFNIGGDLMIDPLWVIKPVKIAAKVGEVTKLSKPINALKEIIEGTSSFKKVRGLISNTTGDKEFDAIVTKFRDLRSYGEGKLIDQAVALQKTLKSVGKVHPNIETIVTEGLENLKSLEEITDPAVLNIVNGLKTTYKGFLNKSREVGLSIGEIMDYAPHIRTKASFLDNVKNTFSLGAREWGTAKVETGRKLQGTIKELGEQGIDIFEKNPAIQLAKKGMAYTKAITSKEFANAVGKFAVKDGMEVTNPLLKGLKFAPELAKVIDNFYQGIKPEELNVVVKTFDKIQNLWKSQALVAPSYHMRNMAGNLWNNFIAGVNPAFYGKAGLLQKGYLKDEALIRVMKQLGVINEGWYAFDIVEEVIKRVEGVKNWKKGLNPLSQENFLLKGNKAVGMAVENNARMAHYMSKIAEGLSPEKAAESVKKYLFDYGDLTKFEQNVLKRFVPFYTWTRKNIPLQLEGLITQPAKYVIPQKLINWWESGVEQPNEKYMSPYISENIPVRMRKNKDGNTEYFLLGTWLPYASAIDFLSQPLDNIVSMLTPALKTPFEQLSNKSTYFKDTFGEWQDIETGYKTQKEYLGQSMRAKNINLLRNIRILNDMDKIISSDKTQATDSLAVKLIYLLFGKAATYDVGKSKYFYDQDTIERTTAIKAAIKKASKIGDKQQVKQLQEELRQMLRERK